MEVDVGEHLPKAARAKSVTGRKWLRSDQSKTVGTAVGHSYHLQLYCEQSLQPVGDPYLFHKPPQWLAKITPLLRIVLPTLDAIGEGLGDNEALMDQLRNAQAFMQSMAELGGPEHGREIDSPRHSRPILARDADYRVLDALLSELDSSRHFRGMTKRLSPRNLVLWMSPEDAEFHKPIEARGPWDRLSET